MRLKDVPIVMVTASSSREKVLDAIAQGCAGYILRPYSEDTFAKHVLRGCQVERVTEIERQQIEDAREMIAAGNFDDAIEAFEEIISEQNMAQKYYDMGCRCLVRQKFGQAIIAFKKAIKLNDLFAEAYKGLADAYKAKGEIDEFKRYLQKAAEVHAQFNRLEETKELFIEILKYDAYINDMWLINIKIIAVFAAVLGHIFPIFAGFRGGKGVATLVGAITGIYPPVVLLCFAVWVVILMMTHYVSLASIVAGCCFPIFTIVSPKVNQSVPFIVFGSQIILKFIDRFPAIIYFGAGLLGWIAGGMIASDVFVTTRWPDPATVGGLELAAGL